MKINDYGLMDLLLALIPEKWSVNGALVKLSVDCRREIFLLLLPPPLPPALSDHAPHTAGVGGQLEGPEEDGLLENIEGARGSHPGG